ncbi:unnamed protein product [Heterobilharzia americana]|nr:unnamed protein product [Heterobilharzia americana]
MCRLHDNMIITKYSNKLLMTFQPTESTHYLPVLDSLRFKQRLKEYLKDKKNIVQPIEEKDLIMDLFEEIEISVLCDIFSNKIDAKNVYPMNITVSERTLYVRIRLRIEQGDCTDQTVFTKWVNYSVGLGVNKIRYTIDPRKYKHLKLPVVYIKTDQLNSTSADHASSVRLNVMRSLSKAEVNKQLLKVCILEQNCLHWMDRSRLCGLQDVGQIFKPEYISLIQKWNQSGGWMVFSDHVQKLCNETCSVYGHSNNKGLPVTNSAWFIPCIRCNNDNDEVNCDWSSALWFEVNNPFYTCIYNKRKIQNDQRLLSLYLKNRVLLFLGDSTLRGLMYSLLHRLNKTLFNVQETHGEITLVNSGAKITRFIYYPDYSMKLQYNKSFTDLLNSLFM